MPHMRREGASRGARDRLIDISSDDKEEDKKDEEQYCIIHTCTPD